MNKCLFDKTKNICICLTEKNCDNCKFYTDSTKHYIDNRTRYIGDIKNGQRLPVVKSEKYRYI